jgi:hypothetical protein
MTLKNVVYNTDTGRYQTSLLYVDEDFDVGGGGQQDFAVAEAFTADSKIDIWVNGILKREGGSIDYTRNVGTQEIQFTSVLAQFAWVRIRVYS